MVSDRDSEFRKKFFEHHAILKRQGLANLTIIKLENSMSLTYSNLFQSFDGNNIKHRLRLGSRNYFDKLNIVIIFCCKNILFILYVN